MSVALANYATSGLGEKTAYLELCGHEEIKHWKEVNDKGYFMDLKIHYYPKFKKEDVSLLLTLGYDKVILDFGDDYSGFREEMLRCDRKVFLINLNPWQKFFAEKLLCTVQKENWGSIEPLYASANILKAQREEVEKKYGISVMEIPVIPDPRCIHRECFSCMDVILERAARESKKRKK